MNPRHWIAIALMLAACAAAHSLHPAHAQQASDAAPGPSPTPTAAEEAARRRQPWTLRSVDIGYATYPLPIKPDRWYPVWIEIASRGQELSGEVQLAQDENPLRVAVPVELARNTAKRLLTFYRFDQDKPPKLHVTVRFNRFRSEETEYPFLISNPGQQDWLALVDEPGGFQFLNETPMALEEDSGERYGGSRVVYGQVGRLPPDAIALEPLDGIMISTSHVRELTAAQLAALSQWVERGGNLILAGGRFQPFVMQSRLKDAWGIGFGEPAAIRLPGAPGAQAAAPVAADVSAIADAAAVAAADGEFLASPLAGDFTQVWLNGPAGPLLAGRRVGQGWVHASALALDTAALEALNSHPGITDTWRRMLSRAESQGFLEQLERPAATWFGYVLQRPFGINLVGVGWVMRYLTLYILVALPLNWWLFSRRGRREWSWASAALLALLFAGYGYFTGTRGQAKGFRINEVTLLSRPAEGATARAVTLSAFYSPRRMRTELQSEGKLVFVSPLGSEGNPYVYRGGDEQDLYAGNPAVAVFGSGTWLGNFFFHPWSARNLRFEFSVDTAAEKLGRVRVAEPVGVEGNRPFGTIVNETPWTFQRMLLVRGKHAWRVFEPFVPGQALDLASLPNIDGNDIGVLRNNLMDEFANFGMGNASQQERMPFFNYESFMQNRRAWYHEPGTLTLVAQAEQAAISPMAGGLAVDQRTSLLLYEQPLTEAPEQQRQVTWSLEPLVDAGGTMAVRHYDVNRVNNSQFPLESLRFRVVPSRPLHLDGETVELSIEWTATSTENIFVFGNGGEHAIRFAGCPVRILNRRTRQVETTIVQRGAPMVLSPARDYFEPGLGTASLVIAAGEDELRYQVTRRNGEQVNPQGEPLKTRKELREEFGESAIPESGQGMQGMPGMQNMPGMGMPGMMPQGMPGMPGAPGTIPGFGFQQIQIDNFNVTIHDGTPAAAVAELTPGSEP